MDMFHEAKSNATNALNTIRMGDTNHPRVTFSARAAGWIGGPKVGWLVGRFLVGERSIQTSTLLEEISPACHLVD
jgi:hypothetical protein